MSETLPMVTVLIPARNEEADIERCLRAVLAQDYPLDRMEIVLVDGGSADRTMEVATGVLSSGEIQWRLIENAIGATPHNLNVGLTSAKGTYVCRVDARSVVPPAYVRRCVEILAARRDVVVVGGAQIATAYGTSVMERGIARALNNRFSMGGARYRSAAPSGPDETVYLGSFRLEDLISAGGWDESLPTNQDFELNRRLGRDGVVWFESGIPVAYRPRRRLRPLFRQYHRFGLAKASYWRTHGEGPLPRQWAILAGGALISTATGTFLALHPRRGRAVGGLAACAVVLGFMVDRAGGPDERATAVERGLAVAAMAAVSTGWLSGVARGVLPVVAAPGGP